MTRWLLAVALAGLGFGCASPAAPPSCGTDPAAVAVGGTLVLRLNVDARVAAADREIVRAAWQDWAACAQVDVHIEELPRATWPEPFPASLMDLRGQSDDAARTQLTAPLDQLKRALKPQPGVVTVAVLPDLVADSSAAATVLPELVGLGLPRDAQQPGPLVLLSARRLVALSRQGRASAVGHETGHALGLHHDGRRCNLMADATGCGVGWLDAAQVQVLRQR